MLARKPKGHWFNSQSGHMPGLQVRSPVGDMWEASTHWCLSNKIKQVSGAQFYNISPAHCIMVYHPMSSLHPSPFIPTILSFTIPYPPPPAITTLLSKSLSSLFFSVLLNPSPPQGCQPPIYESVSILLVSSFRSLDYTQVKPSGTCLSLTSLFHLKRRKFYPLWQQGWTWRALC